MPAAREHPVGLLAALDHRADVRVQGGGEPAGRRPQRPAGRGCASRVAQPCVVELRAVVVALRPGGGGEDDGGGTGCDEAVHRGARRSGRGSWPGSCRTTRDELADRRQPVAAQRRGLVLGGVGQEPVGAELGGGQAELAHLGEHRRPAASWWPQPGTSQTPQEMGAPAMRSARASDGCRPRSGPLDLGEVDDAALGARELAGLGDAEGLERVVDGARAGPRAGPRRRRTRSARPGRRAGSAP